MKILNSKLRNFNKKLDDLLLKRKTKVQTSSIYVIKIINDVKKNGDKGCCFGDLQERICKIAGL